MKADFHIHSRDCSDGRLGIKEIFDYAQKAGVLILSITDHDVISCQEASKAYAEEAGILYVTGVEVSIRYKFQENGKEYQGPLDVLGYGFDPAEERLREALHRLLEHRRKRLRKTIDILNPLIERDGFKALGEEDLLEIERVGGGSVGRPHLADYLISKGYVRDRKEAFERYLEMINLPKFPITLEEASNLIRGAGGKVVLAHPADPNGTSLRKFFASAKDMLLHIDKYMLPYLDGLECWHSRHEKMICDIFYDYTKKRGLLATGGSDCHQNPVMIGSVQVPEDALRVFMKAVGLEDGR